MPKMLNTLQWVGWAIIVLLSIAVAVLWMRLEHQVVENKADIDVLQAKSDADDRALEARLHAGRQLLEARLDADTRNLKRILRDYHTRLAVLSEGSASVPPLDPWLQEKP